MKDELKKCSYADYFYNALYGYPLRPTPLANRMRQQQSDLSKMAKAAYDAHVAGLIEVERWRERSEAHPSSY